MKLNIELEITNPKLAAGMALFKRRWMRGLIGLGLLGIPAVAIASPVTVPNAFTAGEVISASAMNDNFTAVKAAVDDNDTRLTALEGGLNLSACVWRVNQDTAPDIFADCGATMNVVSGSCSSSDPNARLEGAAARPTATSSIMDGDVGGVAQVFNCRYSATAANNTTHAARALCCPGT